MRTQTARTERTERNGILLAVATWIFVLIVAACFLMDEAEVAEYRRSVEAVFARK